MDDSRKIKNTKQPAIPKTIQGSVIKVNDEISVERFSDGSVFIVTEDGDMISIDSRVPYSAIKNEK